MPPGSLSNAQAVAQDADDQMPQQTSQQASQQANTNTEEMQSALMEKETQLAAAQNRADQLSVELAEANRLIEDRQRLLQAQEQMMSDASSTAAKHSMQLEQQLKAKQANFDALQEQLDTNSCTEAAKVQKLQGISVAICLLAYEHAGLRLHLADVLRQSRLDCDTTAVLPAFQADLMPRPACWCFFPVVPICSTHCTLPPILNNTPAKQHIKTNYAM